MIDNIEVGTPTHEDALSKAKQLSEILTRSGHSAQIKEGSFTDKNAPEALKTLLSDAIHVLSFPLRRMTASIPDKLTIAALSTRTDPRSFLFINKENRSGDNAFGLNKSPLIGGKSQLLLTQCKNLIANSEIIELGEEALDIASVFKNNNLDALLLAEAEVKNIEEAGDFDCIRVHTSEIVPETSQGIIAFLTKSDDIELRKKLATCHDTLIGKISNVERKIQLLVKENLDVPAAVYCKTDASGNFHVHSALIKGDTIVKKNLSQSTSAQLAENLFLEIKKSF